MYLFIYLFIYLCVCLFIHVFIYSCYWVLLKALAHALKCLHDPRCEQLVIGDASCMLQVMLAIGKFKLFVVFWIFISFAIRASNYGFSR